MIIFDCEIEKAIRSGSEEFESDVLYCNGWRDFENMGISCIGAYDYEENRYRIFCEDNLLEFQYLIDKHDIIIGFNSLAFDNKLCAANGIVIPDGKSYDILVEIWVGVGLEREYKYPTHTGFSLSAVCKENFELDKSGAGYSAPVLWQRGKNGAVLDYCLWDVQLTKRLLDYVERQGKIRDPRCSNKWIQVRKPRSISGLKRN